MATTQEMVVAILKDKTNEICMIIETSNKRLNTDKPYGFAG